MDGQSGNSHGEHGRFKQILSQFLLKSLHMILDSRVPSIHPYNRKNDQVKKSDKWFSLVSGDHPATLDNLIFWHRNLMDPMIIDIILVNQLEVFNQHRHILNALVEEIRLIKGWEVKFWNSNFIDRSKGLLSSSGSPRIGFSRSSSRISFQDDLDDCDFSCPFIVDDVDNSDLQARNTQMLLYYCHELLKFCVFLYKENATGYAVGVLGGSMMESSFPSMCMSSTCLEGQVNGSINRQHYQNLWQFDLHHQPAWVREDDNTNFITPDNSLLSYDSVANSGTLYLSKC
ncbi:hypothetical protein POM88_007060 [Heracleum sosnowskyi]|uniref:Autophagy-related protein 13 N-terminal domain-containing protein n=1 Tax=Heracleum sosnowskyi TaxID=360622 RepID=A0AAD8J760_9APIA|nr:hypothetical protein POM88_007060 [Heracleum sosnowskyi]